MSLAFLLTSLAIVATPGTGADVRHRGRQWFEVDEGVGMPSRWVTLSALRVLRWADMQ